MYVVHSWVDFDVIAAGTVSDETPLLWETTPDVLVLVVEEDKTVEVVVEVVRVVLDIDDLKGTKFGQTTSNFPRVNDRSPLELESKLGVTKNDMYDGEVPERI